MLISSNRQRECLQMKHVLVKPLQIHCADQLYLSHTKHIETFKSVKRNIKKYINKAGFLSLKMSAYKLQFSWKQTVAPKGAESRTSLNKTNT